MNVRATPIPSTTGLAPLVQDGDD